jgi:restriction system protein
VQCKRWKSKPVGVPIVREMFGILTAERADRATVITTSRFTKESEDFARGKPIDLIDGPKLLSLVQRVQNKPASAEPSEDSTTAPITPSKMATQPLCPKCNAAMVQRTARKGANAGKSFWGCSNYPKCRGVVGIN